MHITIYHYPMRILVRRYFSLDLNEILLVIFIEFTATMSRSGFAVTPAHSATALRASASFASFLTIITKIKKEANEQLGRRPNASEQELREA